MKKLTNKQLGIMLRAAEAKLETARNAVFASEPRTDVQLSIIVANLGAVSPLVIAHQAALDHMEAVRGEGRARLGNVHISTMLSLLGKAGRRKRVAYSQQPTERPQ